MKNLLAFLMALNALIFFFDAVLHTGIVIGPFQQPQIFIATIVETVCGLSLGWGVIGLFRGRPSAGRIALATNVVAAAGVLLGVVPRLLRHRTGSVIALDHRIMLVLIGVSLLILLFARAKPSPG